MSNYDGRDSTLRHLILTGRTNDIGKEDLIGYGKFLMGRTYRLEQPDFDETVYPSEPRTDMPVAVKAFIASGDLKIIKGLADLFYRGHPKRNKAGFGEHDEAAAAIGLFFAYFQKTGDNTGLVKIMDRFSGSKNRREQLLAMRAAVASGEEEVLITKWQTTEADKEYMKYVKELIEKEEFPVENPL